MNEPIIYSVTDFVAVFNQTISTVYPFVVVEGELSSFRVSKGRWVYFDLKDETSNVKFFGTVYQLPGPLEDGMVLRVSGTPQLHPNYGFSINIQSIALAGEGTIKKASQLLEMRLTKEGLFDDERKRALPYPPQRIGLIASGESAAYSDFLKILDARWGGVEVSHYDVQVQGDAAAEQIKTAIEYFNAHNTAPEVLVITRGGGSMEDLQAFSSEPVVRAVAASRIPTLLAIGHERDISLTERAADVRASTPSNAAELLVPDRRETLAQLDGLQAGIKRQLLDRVRLQQERLVVASDNMRRQIQHQLVQKQQALASLQLTLDQINPRRVLQRGYTIVRLGDKNVRSSQKLHPKDLISIEFHDGQSQAEVQ
jgi:exodeoxyribonuclease VII large subunit